MGLSAISVLSLWPVAGAAGEFSRTAASIAVAAMWQGMLLAAGLAIAMRLAPRISAAHRFAVWAAGFVVLIALPFLPLLGHLTASSAESVSSGLASAPAKPWLELDLRWSLAIAGLWVAASLYRAVELAIHGFHLRRLGKSTQLLETEKCPDSFISGYVHIPGRGRVRLYTTKTLQSPGAIGFFRPRILIPEWLTDKLAPAEFEQIVLHEAEHLRRHDDWINLLQKLCLVLFPLNPALWWIDRRLYLEREMACDEGVVRATQEPRSYAACLTSLAERRLERRAETLSLGAWQRRPELMRRVQSILARKRVLSPWATRALVGMLGCGLLAATVELAQSPKLIAFVPAQSAKAFSTEARVDKQANPKRSLHKAGKVLHEVAVERASLRPHAAKTRAVLPRTHHARRTKERVLPAAESARQRARNPMMAASAEPAATAAGSQREVLLKAVLPGAGRYTVTEQQWIIFTAWEEMHAPNRAMRAVAAEYENDRNANQRDGANSARNDGRRANLIVVERLIFRMVPAAFEHVPTTTADPRDGWLVIQM